MTKPLLSLLRLCWFVFVSLIHTTLLPPAKYHIVMLKGHALCSEAIISLYRAAEHEVQRLRLLLKEETETKKTDLGKLIEKVTIISS